MSWHFLNGYCKVYNSHINPPMYLRTSLVAWITAFIFFFSVLVCKRFKYLYLEGNFWGLFPLCFGTGRLLIRSVLSLARWKPVLDLNSTGTGLGIGSGAANSLAGLSQCTQTHMHRAAPLFQRQRKVPQWISKYTRACGADQWSCIAVTELWLTFWTNWLWV